MNLLKKWKQHKQNKQEEKDRAEYREGWCWAMFCYFVEGKTIEGILSRVECAQHFNDYSSFDIGTEAAVDLIRKLIMPAKLGGR